MHEGKQLITNYMGLWLVSMFDFRRSDRGLNLGCGGKSSCLQLHYSAAPLASV